MSSHLTEPSIKQKGATDGAALTVRGTSLFSLTVAYVFVKGAGMHALSLLQS